MTVVYAIAIAAAAFGWWRLSLWRRPYAPCRWCRGRKLEPGSNDKQWGWCRLCKGTGRRLRWGARDASR